MSMAPKDSDIIRGGIAALLDALIGSTGDTGGSQTAGTVMGKENAILKMLKEYDSKVKGNMILKQTPNKTLQVSSTGMLDVDFDFGKPVRIVGIYLAYNRASSSQVTFPLYVINGENSLTTTFSASGNSTLAVFCRTSSSFGFKGPFSDVVPISFDIWATKLQIQIRSGVTAGSNVNAYVLYQEEG